MTTQTMIPDRHGTLYISEQTELGTAGTLAASHALRASQIEWTQRGDPLVDVLDTDSPYPGGVAPVIGSTGWGLSFRVDAQRVTEWRPGGTDIPLLTLLRSLVATVEEDSGEVSIAPPTAFTLGYTATAIRPCTIRYVEDGGNTYTAVDCICTYTLEMSAGGRIQWVFAVHGVWNDPVSTSFTTPPEFTGFRAPLTFRGSELSATPAGGSPLDVLYCSSLQWDPGINLSDVESGLVPDALARSFGWLTEYARLSLEVGAQAESALPVWAAYRGRTITDTEIELPGGIKLAAPYGRLRPPERVSRYEARGYDLEIDCVPSDAGDALYALTWEEEGAS